MVAIFFPRRLAMWRSRAPRPVKPLDDRRHSRDPGYRQSEAAGLPSDLERDSRVADLPKLRTTIGAFVS